MKHGRGAIVYPSGDIFDSYYKDGKNEGPALYIYHTGNYKIIEFVNGLEESSALYWEDGTLYVSDDDSEEDI